MRRRELFPLLAAAALFPADCLAAGSEGQELASKGFNLLSEGKPSEALAVLREAAKRDPGNPWLFNLMGRAAFEAGDLRQAAESFRTALRIDAADGYSRMMLDILSQKPAGPAKPEARPEKRRRSSQLEEDARAELDAFARTGKAPGARVILVDPGHGGADRGVQGPNGVFEKDVCLKLGLALASELGSVPGFRAVLTREADHDVPLWARAAMSGLFAASLVVSLHCTAAEGGWSGADVFTFSPQASGPQAHAVAELENGVTRFERSLAPGAGVPWEGELLAGWRARRRAAASQELAARVRAALEGQGVPGGVRAMGAPLKVLGGCACPALLVEAGYLSSQRDAERLANAAAMGAIAKTLARALTEGPG